MRQARLVALAVIAALSGLPGTGRAADPVEAAAAARTELTRAAGALEAARTAEEKLAALGRAAGAAESALAAYREALRALDREGAALRAAMAADSASIEALASALQRLARAPRAALLAYPGGPVDAVRAASLMASVAPALDRRRLDLALRIEALDSLAARQEDARHAAQAVLGEVQRLRAETAKVVIEGAGAEPSRAALREQAARAAAQARDLAGLAGALGTALPSAGPGTFAGAAQPTALPLPVAGRIVAGYGAPDPWGRPGRGLTLAAPPWAEVRAPVAATVRYAGPLTEYGNVIILEPESGWLIVIAGLGRVTRAAGEEVAAGTPLGDLGGLLPSNEEFLLEASQIGGEIRDEKLYIELRQDGEAIDPAPWFGSRGKRGP